MITNEELARAFIVAAKQGGTAVQVMNRFYAEYPSVPRSRMQAMARQTAGSVLKTRTPS